MIYFYGFVASVLLTPWALFLVGWFWTFRKRDGYTNRLKIMYALDRLGGALIDCRDGELISTMLGRRYAERKRYAFWRLVVDLVWLVVLGQRDHCRQTYKKYSTQGGQHGRG